MGKEFEYKEEYSWLTNICLNLTDACNYRCKYCAPAGTKILMSDWSQKNIEDINTNDLVIGCDENNERNMRKSIYPTKVLGTMSRQVDELYKITMSDGKEIYLTDNHPVLNGRGKWTQVKNLREKTGMIMSLKYLPKEEDKPDIYNIDYIKGYFLAMWLTDGMHNQYDYDSGHIVSIRLAVKDDEIIQRMKEYCDILHFNYNIRNFKISEKENLIKPAIFSGKQESYNFIENLRLDLINNIDSYKKNKEYLSGFAAACYDAEGHIDRDGKTISITNSDTLILDMWESALIYLGFKTKRDPESGGINAPVYRSRLLITSTIRTLEDQIKLFTKLQPAVSRKTFKALFNCSPLFRNTIEKIEKIKGDFTVYNFETESHTYIANGLVVHNCFVEQNPHYMTLDVAMDSLNFILQNLEKKNKKFNKNNKAHITYFGGEPTLMWDEIIVPLTNHVRDNNLPVTFSMTTNGSLLNKERIQFLKEKNIPILLSIDGAEETQCFNRPCPSGNSFDLTSKWIPDILNAFPNTTFRGTIYAPTVQYTFENYIFAALSGFKNFFFIPDSRHPWTEEQKNILKQEMNKIFSFLDYCFINNQVPLDSSLFRRGFCDILKNDLLIKEPNLIKKEVNRSISRCGLGTNLGSIGYDGKIYGCQEQTSKSNGNIFYIGDIYSGIDKNKHNNLLKIYNSPSSAKCQNNELCASCSLKNICNSFACPSTSWDLFEDFFTDSEIHCLYLNIIFDNCSILMNKLVAENNQTFKQYLDDICHFKSKFKRGET